MSGYGKTAGLPYDEYLQQSIDFAPIWFDPETTGPSQGTGGEGKGVNWYVDGAKRYKSGTWPREPIAWFDKSGAVIKFDTRPPSVPTPVYIGDCTNGCPSTGTSTLTTGTPSPDGFTAEVVVSPDGDRD
jgi:hypothetical protein